jgi:predicted ATPase
VVLLDEFENGFHYSVLSKLWEAVSEFAQNNPQIFASTHSEECIRAAHTVFNEQEYAFRLFRLAPTRDGIRAKAFDREALDVALKTGLETRWTWASR